FVQATLQAVHTVRRSNLIVPSRHCANLSSQSLPYVTLLLAQRAEYSAVQIGLHSHVPGRATAIVSLVKHASTFKMQLLPYVLLLVPHTGAYSKRQLTLHCAEVASASMLQAMMTTATDTNVFMGSKRRQMESV
ncbi:hypothetical protein DYB26_016265, partial [Aphanomyces astaci]